MNKILSFLSSEQFYLLAGTITVYAMALCVVAMVVSSFIIGISFYSALIDFILVYGMVGLHNAMKGKTADK